MKMNWIMTNKEWLFSGAGLVLVGFLFNYIHWHRRIIRETNRDVSGTLNNSDECSNIIIYNNRKVEKRMMRLNDKLRSAQTIHAVGLGLYEFTTNATIDFYKDFLIKRKGNLKLLFLNPDGKEIVKRNNNEDREESALSQIVNSNIKDLHEILKECYEDNPLCIQNIDIRTYDRPLQLNAIFIDYETIFVQHYGEKSRGAEAPSFQICKALDEHVFNWYLNEFNYLIENHSKPLDILKQSTFMSIKSS